MNVTLYVPDRLWAEYLALREQHDDAKPHSQLLQLAITREIKRLQKREPTGNQQEDRL